MLRLLSSPTYALLHRSPLHTECRVRALQSSTSRPVSRVPNISACYPQYDTRCLEGIERHVLTSKDLRLLTELL